MSLGEIGFNHSMSIRPSASITLSYTPNIQKDVSHIAFKFHVFNITAYKKTIPIDFGGSTIFNKMVT